VKAHAAATAALANSPPVVRWTGFFCEGYVLEEGTDAERVFADAHTRVFAAPLKSFTTPAYLDARVTMLYDKIPTLVYGPLSRNIHGIDEAVDLASVKRISKTIALFVARWCGIAAREGIRTRVRPARRAWRRTSAST
jgi:acetylornithine deacetylase